MTAPRSRAGGRTQAGPHSPWEPVDYLLLDPQLGLFLVLDAGGSWSELRGQSGRTAAEAIRGVIAEELSTNSEPRAIIAQAFRAADAALRAETDENGWHGGASVTLVLLRDHQVFVSWLGDTMAHRVTDNQIEPLTQPHTGWNELVRRGAINEVNEATANPALRNVLIYVLGGELPDPLEVVSFAPQPGERLVLTTDGITNHIPDSTILNACRDIADPTTCAEAIIEHAILAGSRDNCTCVVIVFES